jgi:hypothetical protein
MGTLKRLVNYFKKQFEVKQVKIYARILNRVVERWSYCKVEKDSPSAIGNVFLTLQDIYEHVYTGSRIRIVLTICNDNKNADEKDFSNVVYVSRECRKTDDFILGEKMLNETITISFNAGWKYPEGKDNFAYIKIFCVEYLGKKGWYDLIYESEEVRKICNTRSFRKVELMPKSLAEELRIQFEERIIKKEHEDGRLVQRTLRVEEEYEDLSNFLDEKLRIETYPGLDELLEETSEDEDYSEIDFGPEDVDWTKLVVFFYQELEKLEVTRDREELEEEDLGTLLQMKRFVKGVKDKMEPRTGGVKELYELISNKIEEYREIILLKRREDIRKRVEFTNDIEDKPEKE